MPFRECLHDRSLNTSAWLWNPASCNGIGCPTQKRTDTTDLLFHLYLRVKRRKLTIFSLTILLDRVVLSQICEGMWRHEEAK